jgi:septum formation protein
MMNKVPDILLASQSPRRATLLSEAGYRYTLVKIDVEEVYPPGLKEAEVAVYLAGLKAAAVKDIPAGHILLTADTIVCLEDEVINKPKDAEDAKRMLAKLSGKMHVVHTGICLRSQTQKHSFSERTEVYFKAADKDEIDFYVTGYKPLDKAGAYGIQEWFGYNFVSKINGDFYNVMGLPLARLYEELKKFSI